jgi:hypothetical protein
MALSGNHARALRLARAGLLVGGWRVLNESYAGQFARWVALVKAEHDDQRGGLEILETALPNPKSLHTKDLVELRSSQVYLKGMAGSLDVNELNDVREELAALPAGISTILRALGMHPDRWLSGQLR